MLNDTKDYVTEDDSNRVSKFLEIVCNMYKCKYVTLTDLTLKETIPSTTILINLNSIIIDWLKMCGDDADFSHITAEEISCRLLEVVAHYRRFYEDYGKCSKTWVFCYGSKSYMMWNGNVIDLIPKTILDKAQSEIAIGIGLTKIVSNYIPGFYVIWDNDHPTRYPSVNSYYIISSMVQKSIKDSLNRKQRVLIVSGNELDFCGLGLNDVNMNFRIFGFKRKHPTIFTSSDILSKLIYRHRKIPMRPPLRFIEMYPIISFVMIASFGECAGYYLDHPRILDVKKWAAGELNRLNKLNGFELQTETDKFINEFKSKLTYRPVQELYNFVNVPFNTRNEFAELQSEQVRWKTDMIDYSIEALNENHFKHFKVDFKSLF